MSSSKNSFVQRYSGSIIALSANLGFSLMDTTAQSCTRDGMAPGQVAFVRMAMTLLVLSTYVIIYEPDGLLQLDPRSHSTSNSDQVAVQDAKRSTLSARNPALAARLIWLRSILLSLSLCFLYASLSRIALSEFVSIASTRSFLTGFLCWLFIRENFGWRLQIASVISTLAVILIVQPPWLFGDSASGDMSSRASGFLFCIANLIVDSMEMTVTRVIGKGPDPIIITLAYAATCSFVAPMYMLFAGETYMILPPIMVVIKLSAVAITGLIAQIGLIMALQRETGGTVAVIAYSQIPFSVIIQSFVLLDIPDLVQGVGMVVIAISGIWAIVAESTERDIKDEKDLDGYALLPASRGEDGLASEESADCVHVKPLYSDQ